MIGCCFARWWKNDVTTASGNNRKQEPGFGFACLLPVPPVVSMRMVGLTTAVVRQSFEGRMGVQLSASLTE